MSKLYHCIILSTKSAGSSALQKFLVQDYGFKMSQKTHHHENETLFWAKAASILGLLQLKMHRSHIPYSNSMALKSLHQFSTDNLMGSLKAGDVTKEALFNLYLNLITQNKPRFVEKSPHHLFNQSNLDLIGEFISLFGDSIDFKVIGLVRHPLSVIYSGWERWRYDCKRFEREWLVSNQNLLRNKSQLGIDIIRYEDLVAENGMFLSYRLNLEPMSNSFLFRKSSLYKWKADKAFGHVLSNETVELAKDFGYSDFETAGEQLPWRLKSWSAYAVAELRHLLRHL